MAQAIGLVFCLNLPVVHSWLDAMSSGRASSELYFQVTFKKKFSEEKDGRPSAVEIWRSAVAIAALAKRVFWGMLLDIGHG